MTCRDFIEFLMDYVSGALAAEERAIFDAHLAECPSCVAYLKTYQETVKLGQAVLAETEEAVPPSVPEELVAAVRAARRKGGLKGQP
jgi:anti-sigma factor RsiW